MTVVVEMVKRGSTTAHARLHGLTIISGVLHTELKSVAGMLNAFGEDPINHPVSPTFERLQQAAAFCGFWGIANMLGGIKELAVGIESTPPLSVDRGQYLERVRTLAAGVNALGTHLRDMNLGVAVSYTILNEHFAKIIRKARPAMLDLSPAEAAPMIFMPAPPSIEVDAFWTAAASASLESLRDTLASVVASEDFTPALLSSLAAANPYASLSGLFDAVASLPEFCADATVADLVRIECQRLQVALEAGPPMIPPAPHPFIFSRLLYQLALSESDDPAVKAMRRRYRLTKPRADGAPAASMLDVAKKFADGMAKFQDAYTQSAISNTAKPIKRLAANMLTEAHRLESPAFSTLSASLAQLTHEWDVREPARDEWERGAVLLMLMSETARNWGVHDVQEELSVMADLLSTTGQGYACASMQRAVRHGAISKACAEIIGTAGELKVAIEAALRAVAEAELSDSQCRRMAENGGKRAADLLQVVCGLSVCIGLPAAEQFAIRLSALVTEPQTWSTPVGRSVIFDGLTRLNEFVARLRPGSLIDIQSDELGQFAPPALLDEDAPHYVIAKSTSVSKPASLDVDQPVPVKPEHLVEPDQVVEQAPANDDVRLAALEHPAAAHVIVLDTLDFEAVIVVEHAPLAAVAEAAEPATPVHKEPEPDALDGDVTPAPADAEPVPVNALAAPLEQDEDVFAFVETSGGDPFDFVADAPGVMSTALASSPADINALRVALQDAAVGQPNALDTDDVELMRIMFEESEQCLTDIDKALATWTTDVTADTRIGTVGEARRHVHTLKGVCRTCGLMGVGAVLHALEDHLEVMPDDGLSMGPFAAVYSDAMGAVRTEIESARRSFENAPATPDPVTPVFEPAEIESVPDLDEAVAEVPTAAIPELHVHAQVEDATPVHAPAAGDPVIATSAPVTAVSAPTHRSDVSVRVPVSVAARVGDASGQVLMASRKSLEHMDRSTRQLQELQGNLRRMAPVLRELDILATASIPSAATGGAEGFDPLELDRYTALQELVRQLKEAFEDTMGSSGSLSATLQGAANAEEERAQLTDDLQRESSALMLVGVATQRNRLERVVAKACVDASKSASLVIEPGCKVPAAAIDRLMPVFEHLLRNAIAHGVESATARARAGKQERGVITIGRPVQARTDGSVVRIAVRDDGAGIDAAKVLAIARKRGLAPIDEQFSTQAIHEFLFMPGFSTASSVSELSGRGVGLDAVRAAVSALGGMVTIESTLGTGTEFVLTLPTDSASMAVVPVVSRGFKCLLPLTLVARIVPVSSGLDVRISENGQRVSIGESDHELIDFSRRVPGHEKQGDFRSGRGHLVLMHDAGTIKAVRVDAVGAQTRVIVKPLGPFVRDIPGMVAGTTLPDGDVGLVVNPLLLREIVATPVETAAAQPAVKHVMVVDDSSTVQLVTSRFLKRNGYEASTASDGLLALQLLAKGVKPTAFLLDLEMPGMGGFELMAELRRKPDFASTPIVVISSRNAAKHRERAEQLGATAYLVKPYEEGQLLDLLEGLIGLPA